MSATANMLVQVLQVAATAIGTYALCFGVLTAECNDHEKKLAELESNQREIEANQRKAAQEVESDLAKWQDGIAAHVGQDLEDVADKLMLAIEANRRGEDVQAALYQVHIDLSMVVADLMTMNPDEEL